MRPGLYLLEQTTTWTLRRVALAVTNEAILWGYVSILHAACQQIAAHIQRILRGQFAHKAANETYAQRHFIVAQGVGADCLPAASLVNVAVTANKKVVGNIIPAATLDVKTLTETKKVCALAQRHEAIRNQVRGSPVCRVLNAR